MLSQYILVTVDLHSLFFINVLSHLSVQSNSSVMTLLDTDMLLLEKHKQKETCSRARNMFK